MSSKISSSRIQIQHAQEEESKKLILISIKRNNLFQLQFSLVTFGFLRELSVSCKLKSNYYFILLNRISIWNLRLLESSFI